MRTKLRQIVPLAAHLTILAASATVTSGGWSAPAEGGHPEPRVIVSVDTVVGPHEQSAVQAKARAGFWHSAVRCYKQGAYKNQELAGATTISLRISSGGKVASARLVDTELEDRTVAECLAQRAEALAMPSASGNSKARMVVQLWPGDVPVSPP